MAGDSKETVRNAPETGFIVHVPHLAVRGIPCHGDYLAADAAAGNVPIRRGTGVTLDEKLYDSSFDPRPAYDPVQQRLPVAGSKKHYIARLQRGVGNPSQRNDNAMLEPWRHAPTRHTNTNEVALTEEIKDQRYDFAVQST